MFIGTIFKLQPFVLGRNFAVTHRNKMIQIAVCGRSELQGAETDVIQGLIINAECLVSIFD